jgi:hypothetical protein
MKNRHNKKRNTAFLFEVLVLELTKSIVSKQAKRSAQIKRILKENFNPSSVLGDEMRCYKALKPEESLDKESAQRLVQEAKTLYGSLSQKDIFKKQTRVINEINKKLGRGVFSNFVADYQVYATMSQVFGTSVPLRKKVILERKLVDHLQSGQRTKTKMKTPNTLELQTFANLYNKKYGTLIPEQKEFLTKYITSLGDNGVDFKIFAARELKRIKEEIENSLSSSEISEDDLMLKNTGLVLEQVNSLSVNRLSEKDIMKVLKLQSLVKEYSSHDD